MRKLRWFSVVVAWFVLADSRLASQGLERQYREPAARLIGAALVGSSGWDKLEYLSDRIGHRLSGSKQLEEAIDWAEAQMKRDGLDNVYRLPVKVPHWVRGNESVEILSPIREQIAMLGLGMSVGTPEEGITADVVVVSSFDELEAIGRERVEGRIVLFDVPFTTYGATVAYRSAGPSRAAALGAVAVMIRSVGPVSLQTPHTGSTRYSADAPRIPAAALTIEDAGRIHRLTDRGQTVRVRLRMEAHFLEDADSFNVVGEIRGRELPDEVVVLGGHLDSWDVGQGAHDDGAGCVAAMEAAHLIRNLELRPRRTIRVVLWTNEENGLRGALAYREWVGGRIGDHVAAIEMDGGSERPIGFGMGMPTVDRSVRSAALVTARQIGRLLEGIGAGQILDGGGGADIGPLMRDGVPGFGLRTVGRQYFDWHHTRADTLDKIDPEDFRRNVAALAVLSYVLADMPDRLAGSN